MNPQQRLSTLDILRYLPWQVYACFTTLPALVIALGLLVYPDVYNLAHNYDVLARIKWLPAKALGALGVLPSLWVLVRLPHRDAILALYGVMLFMVILATGSILAVGMSGLSALFLLVFFGNLNAFIRSGGFPKWGP